jgi:hypothetical protein
LNWALYIQLILKLKIPSIPSPLACSLTLTLYPKTLLYYLIPFSATMSETATSEVMYGTAGVVNGKLQLSQGITRDLSRGGIGGQFTEIPVIDLSAMTNPSSSPEDKAKLVTDIRAACSRVGFFVIKNHGIEWKIADDAFDGLKEFFDLPMEKKMEVHQSMSDSYQGYEQPYYTNVDRLKKGGELSPSRIYYMT